MMRLTRASDTAKAIGIDQPTAEEIVRVRTSVPIAELVGETVALAARDADTLIGCCPFHDERTPSLVVSPARGFWHCFGCGEGGDAIAFAMRVTSTSFADAVRALTQRLEQRDGDVVPLRGRPASSSRP